ncbi:ICMT-domain-containing protein [Trichocladium antarcticum]|uniref:Protein-S-isoprenylcysteine O-methyltransferase n=1 Tax=Trichocladium antarcticum TaxID=1450529 RepID=A0AAN6USD6_9PEZI|nr:ICMT-domain-containing protein [Trichocladium antarcticum]
MAAPSSQPSLPRSPLALCIPTNCLPGLNTAASESSPLANPRARLSPATSSSPRPRPRPPADYLYHPHQPKSLAGIATRAFALGSAFALGVAGTLALVLHTPSPLWRLPFFAAALALFHFLEFWTTAAYNTRAAETSSFLLTSNWPGYAIAHTFASLECLASTLLWPGATWLPFPGARAVLGVALVAVGQAVRTVAMVRAGRSFNHLVQHRRNSGHVLVTGGIYGWLRHPSYFGFFWWALGTQLAMGNAASLVGFAVVMWQFFSGRIRREEESLVRFFGAEYVEYRRRVGTLIPFVP